MEKAMSESKAEEPLDNPCWLTGGGAFSEINYCRSCAEKEVANYGDDCFVDGGWGQEADTPIQCDRCHVPLRAYLDEADKLIETRAEWNEAVAEGA